MRRGCLHVCPSETDALGCTAKQARLFHPPGNLNLNPGHTRCCCDIPSPAALLEAAQQRRHLVLHGRLHGPRGWRLPALRLRHGAAASRHLPGGMQHSRARRWLPAMVRPTVTPRHHPSAVSGNDLAGQSTHLMVRHSLFAFIPPPFRFFDGLLIRNLLTGWCLDPLLAQV